MYVCIFIHCLNMYLYVCNVNLLNFYSEREGTASSLVISSQISRDFIELPSNSAVKLKFDNVCIYIHMYLYDNC